jgi:multidrug efflux pump subunit AcrA (membrane-fusion protein)
MRIPDGVAVSSGEQLGSIQRTGFHIRLPVTDPASLYTFVSPPRRARGQIIGGPAGFVVHFERLTHVQDSDDVTVYVTLPSTVHAFAGLHAVVVFVTGEKSDVPALPSSAIQGGSGTGQAVVVGADGHTEPVTVQLGTADGQYVQVSGLPVGTKVLLYPLDSDFAK